MYEPGHWVARVSPTPLLMIVALADNITLTDLQLRAYEQTTEPKKLVTIDGGHFDPYLGQFAAASTVAVSWFRQHLGQDQRPRHLKATSPCNGSCSSAGAPARPRARRRARMS